ncbi:hypothetical protein MPH_02423 [Macrophomina phaseolina MS6]|uniref:Uncharacterized protein n=1 Tax=Macrophomina phaseolina (strain MS6) TaxID=1126212 RepID=K2SUB3_MACPH|nr:hypothetical protein MPH_02423 [Macrophomina phaseolina MS6]
MFPQGKEPKGVKLRSLLYLDVEHMECPQGLSHILFCAEPHCGSSGSAEAIYNPSTFYFILFLPCLPKRARVYDNMRSHRSRQTIHCFAGRYQARCDMKCCSLHSGDIGKSNGICRVWNGGDLHTVKETVMISRDVF